MLHRAGLTIAIVVIVVGVTRGEKYTPDQIRQAIAELGDKRFSVREKASRLLWEAGADAEAPLRQALNSPDAETVRRAKALLDKFNWGIFPDTPPEIVEQINLFRDGDKAV